MTGSGPRPPSLPSPEEQERRETLTKYVQKLIEREQKLKDSSPSGGPTEARHKRKLDDLQAILSAPDINAEFESARTSRKITREEWAGLDFYHAGRVSGYYKMPGAGQASLRYARDRAYGQAVAKARRVFTGPARSPEDNDEIVNQKLSELILLSVEARMQNAVNESSEPLERLDAARRVFAGERLARPIAREELGKLTAEREKRRIELQTRLNEQERDDPLPADQAAWTDQQRAEAAEREEKRRRIASGEMLLTAEERERLDAADAMVREYEASRAVYFGELHGKRQRQIAEARVRINDVRGLINRDPAGFQRLNDLHANQNRTPAEETEYRGFLSRFAITGDEKARLLAYRARNLGERPFLNRKRREEENRAAEITHFTPDLLDEFENQVIPKEALDKTVFEEGNNLYDENTKALTTGASGAIDKFLGGIERLYQSYRGLNWKTRAGIALGSGVVAVGLGPLGLAIPSAAGVFLISRRVFGSAMLFAGIEAGLIKRYARTKKEEVKGQAEDIRRMDAMGQTLIQLLEAGNDSFDTLVEDLSKEVRQAHLARRTLAVGVAAMAVLVGPWLTRTAFGATTAQTHGISKWLKSLNPWEAEPQKLKGPTSLNGGKSFGEGNGSPPPSAPPSPLGAPPSPPSGTGAPSFRDPSLMAPSPAPPAPPSAAPGAPVAPAAPGALKTFSLKDAGSVEGALQRMGATGPEAHRIALGYMNEVADNPTGTKAQTFIESLRSAGYREEQIQKGFKEFKDLKGKEFGRFFEGAFRRMAKSGEVVYDANAKTMDLRGEKFLKARSAIRAVGQAVSPQAIEGQAGSGARAVRQAARAAAEQAEQASPSGTTGRAIKEAARAAAEQSQPNGASQSPATVAPSGGSPSGSLEAYANAPSGSGAPSAPLSIESTEKSAPVFSGSGASEQLFRQTHKELFTLDDFKNPGAVEHMRNIDWRQFSPEQADILKETAREQYLSSTKGIGFYPGEYAEISGENAGTFLREVDRYERTGVSEWLRSHRKSWFGWGERGRQIDLANRLSGAIKTLAGNSAVEETRLKALSVDQLVNKWLFKT